MQISRCASSRKWGVGVLECWVLDSSLHYSIAPLPQSLIPAAADLGWTACGFQSFLANFDVDNLLVGRLFVRLDVAVLDGVLNGPLRALSGEAGIDAPDAVLDEVIISEVDRILRFFGGFHHDRNHLF